MSIEVRPITPAIGAQLSGGDLSRPLAAAEVETVSRPLHEHLVLVFRNDEPEAIARLIGAARHASLTPNAIQSRRSVARANAPPIPGRGTGAAMARGSTLVYEVSYACEERSGRAQLPWPKRRTEL